MHRGTNKVLLVSFSEVAERSDLVRICLMIDRTIVFCSPFFNKLLYQFWYVFNKRALLGIGVA